MVEIVDEGDAIDSIVDWIPSDEIERIEVVENANFVSFELDKLKGMEDTDIELETKIVFRTEEVPESRGLKDSCG